MKNRNTEMCRVSYCFFMTMFVSFASYSFAEIAKGDIVIKLEAVATGLTAPIYATNAGDGSGRLFIVEQSGQIRIVENDVLLPTPFLDIADKIPALNSFFDERGLLGLAFHPDYATNGRFFIRYSVPRDGDSSEPCFGTSRGCHSEVLAEYSVSADNPNLADPTSEIILFTIDEPQFNHDAGNVAFGPDGFLYFTLGDGGGAHDGLADSPVSHGPTGHGQNIETALGSILRIDVDSPPQAPLAYAIPPDNPFVGKTGLDEIYAYGMRNPYRFSFDNGPGGDGSLFLADVGQNLFEEINIVEKGGNYGWAVREAFHCFDPFNPLSPPLSCPGTGPIGEPLLDPIAEYAHPGSGFSPEGGITVVGGFVYRGSRSPSLVGKYVFGDFSGQFVVPSGRLYYLDESTPGDFEIREFQIGADDIPYGLFLKGFGEGEDGE
ncbi:MAG: PQQ-dependent sugar dehydrogenase, partial [Planctomycetota bacterium]